jgi:uncharacterized protein (TIGR03382 family)
MGAVLLPQPMEFVLLAAGLLAVWLFRRRG